MARRGENIHKRKDGRWEGRYIKARTPDRRICWGYFHAQTLILCNEIFFQLLIQLRLSAFLRSTSGTSSTAPLHQKSFFAFF